MASDRVDRTCLFALWVIEQALHDCRYTGPLSPPQPGLRLALAYLYQIAGDDPGVGARSREPFDEVWRLIMNTAGDKMGNGDRARASYADTQYARIRRMVRYPQTIENDERLRIYMGAN
jgi:hypothetical protein